MKKFPRRLFRKKPQNSFKDNEYSRRKDELLRIIAFYEGILQPVTSMPAEFEEYYQAVLDAFQGDLLVLEARRLTGGI
jgi:hypothetical protein